MLRLIARLFMVALLCVSTARGEGPNKDPLPELKKGLSDKSALLLDVREKKEWDAGHLQDAVHFPLSEMKGAGGKKETFDLPKDKPIYLHCAKGIRAETAADLLSAQGYQVVPLRSGFNALCDAGFPVASPKN